MRRRDVIVFLGGIASASPTAARAQESRIRRVGVLMTVPSEDQNGRDRAAVFLQALQERGWTKDLNVRFDFGWADDAELLRQYADELVALMPDVILAGSGLAVRPLQQATRTVPVVFAATINPIGRGYVGSLSRLGGNTTGF